MIQEKLTIYVVDDDASGLEAMGRLLRSAGLQAKLFRSISSLLAVRHPASRSCILADARLAVTLAPDLPELLRRRGWSPPVIFLTGEDALGFRAAAKRAGAAGFFHKPVDDQALIDAIEWAAMNGA